MAAIAHHITPHHRLHIGHVYGGDGRGVHHRLGTLG